ncbi:hypothetical protein PIB30_061506 [Stylosanthes scabra]|uniref:Uncharacterized protein n=1 Tax=Stylosanthes scabra TaxID=79078 RepID=A0ABU6TL77_9FABA|nr:hypothetical protein [Stylosanthes scabra]
MSSGARPRGRGSPKSKDAKTLIERDSGSARWRHKNMGKQQQRAMESDKTCDKMEDGAALAVSTGWGRRNLLCLAFGSALKGAREIWLLSNFDSQKDIAYPNDTRVPIKVNDDLKQLFHSIELPLNMIDIEKDLQKNGMKPDTNMAERMSAAQIQGFSSKPKEMETYS